MDLSWCIICDTRVDDGLADSLYCSPKCMARDQAMNQPNLQRSHSRPQKSPTSLRKRPQAFFVLPLYRRRRSVVRRLSPAPVQPTVRFQDTTRSRLS
ncbi:hypothetical protein CLU79DRAFT_756072 [Phycomyces nitens]|nr:hypothetical protein CLU79DRAFT_756072 [Phycomyces nitens]